MYFLQVEDQLPLGLVFISCSHFEYFWVYFVYEEFAIFKTSKNYNHKYR